MKRTLLAAALSLVTLSAQAEIKTEEIVYRVGDQEFTGYLAYDAAVEGKRPGVLVLHEWWGHNDYARERARMLAELGYTGFALDMYGTDKLADNPDAARGHMNDLMNVPGQVTERFEAAYALVRSHPTVDGERMGALGYCMGGSIVLNMARAGADLDAVATYHAGLGTQRRATPGSIKAPLKVFNGAADPFVPRDQVTAFKAEMEAAGASLEFFDYPDVLHSFTNPAADGFGEEFGMPLKYDAEADRDSWARTEEFLREQLGR